MFYTAGRVSRGLDLPIITAEVIALGDSVQDFKSVSVVDKEPKGMRWGKGSRTAVTDRKCRSYMKLICLLLKK